MPLNNKHQVKLISLKDRLVQEDIIKPVECPTDWVNSLVCVTKPNGEIRLCLDPKDLNKYIKRPHYYSPTIDDVLPDLCGSKYFSTLDARSGYWNIPLDHKSQLLTTFNTPGYGRFCFKRLPFGLVSSQDLFQKVMDDTLLGLNNAKPVADDIKIHGKSELEHDLYLLEVLDRCQQAGLHLNPDKCQIKKSSVKFYGNLLTTTGMQPDPKKVDDIVKLASPTKKQELRSLVGMVTYLNRFIQNTTSLLEPLRKLLKNDIHFSWDETHDHAFERIKAAIRSACNLSYFDKNKPCEIQCDASLKGLGCCLIQDGKTVYFASKSLTETESRYSNIEREMLGVVFALTRLRQYTFGRHVTIITDHKPLESLNNKNLNMCPPRLQRMLLRIQEYDFNIKYRPGTKIPIPDCLSRLIPLHKSDPAISGMNISVNEIVMTPESKLETIRSHLNNDNDLLTLRDFVMNGWPNDRSLIPASIIPYWPYKEELGYYNGILLKCDRVIIPSSLVPDVLKDIHRGHLGIEKCRLRARRSVFWPNMNIDIAKLVNSCGQCQVHAGPQNKNFTYNMNESSHYPMHCIGTDLFEYNNKPYLIMVDYFSSYPWIRPLRNISSLSVIEAMKSVFSEFGYPDKIHSDSGSQYSSKEFNSFTMEYDIKHSLSSPYYHESNGKSERYVGIVKKLLRKCTDINDALLAYRSAPLCNSKHSPAELMFNRNIKDHIVSVPLQYKSADLDGEIKPDQYRYNKLFPGDKIFIFDTERKMWEKGAVVRETDQPNQYQVLFHSGRVANRNRVHIKPDHTTPISLSISPKNSDIVMPDKTSDDINNQVDVQIPCQNDGTLNTNQNSTCDFQDNPSNIPLRRSNRNVSKPVKFKDYEL